MDSVSQLALGAAVGIAVMGRRTAVWKAAAWGAVCGTLPDLDALIDHGDAIRNMTFHRAHSHALFWLTLASPALAWVAARGHHEEKRFGRWWWAVWLALITHPLLDAMTVYGTQLALPFSDHPFGVGSIFIIDPLYTLPLVAGVVAGLAGRSTRGLRWNLAGLALSTAYLAWSAAAQQHVRAIAERSLRDSGVSAQRLLVTPTAFNTVLWRVVVMSPGAYHEGFYSLLDREQRMAFDRFDSGESLYAVLAGQWHVDRIAWFSRGFFKVSEQGPRVLISDLRMGQEPAYTFAFAVAERHSERMSPIIPPLWVGKRPDVERTLAWMWRRARGETLPPPR